MPKQQPQWQPISMLPTIATQIDGLLKTAQAQYQTLLPAKAKPYALDDYTVNLVKDIFTNHQNDLWLFDEQLTRWLSASITGEQRQEIERLTGQMKKLREQVTTILELADDLSKGTIEKVMAKSNAELGLEFLLNPGKMKNI